MNRDLYVTTVLYVALVASAADSEWCDVIVRLGRYFRSPTQQTTVRPECRGATDFFGKEVRPTHHTTPLLRDWLRIPERIQFRLCVLSYRCLHGTAPSYLADSLRRCADTEGHRRLRSSVTDTLVVPLTNRSTLGDVGSQWLRHGPGMVCLRRSELQRLCTHSVGN